MVYPINCDNMKHLHHFWIGMAFIGIGIAIALHDLWQHEKTSCSLGTITKGVECRTAFNRG